jgi:hypothetical protein
MFLTLQMSTLLGELVKKRHSLRLHLRDSTLQLI